MYERRIQTLGSKRVGSGVRSSCIRNKTRLGIGHSFLARGQVVVGVDRLLEYGLSFVESLAFGFGGRERRGVGTEFPNLLVVTWMLYEEASVNEPADERIASGIGGRDRLRWGA